jgi:uncharacterized Zn finger protein
MPGAVTSSRCSGGPRWITTPGIEGVSRGSSTERPADALAVYQRIVGEVLETADRRAYRSAARILQRAQAVAQAAGEFDAFGEYLTRVREQHRRRPTLIAILDKANLR